MERKMIFTLLGVVCCVAPCAANIHQSGASDVNDLPMEAPRNVETGIVRPEVVLQLKYEQGELNRIYLTQFRKDLGPVPAVPAVPAPDALCADLCHAGLGGRACGDTCTDMIPVGLAAALRSENQTTTQFGTPRAHVCPVLCANDLGIPLCNCQTTMDREQTTADWENVCAAFCVNDAYVLEGCPPCKKNTITPVPVQANLRILNTSEGWITWCNVQCRQGQGGAACNCDRTPFQ